MHDLLRSLVIVGSALGCIPSCARRVRSLNDELAEEGLEPCMAASMPLLPPWRRFNIEALLGMVSSEKRICQVTTWRAMGGNLMCPDMPSLEYSPVCRTEQYI